MSKKGKKEVEFNLAGGTVEKTLKGLTGLLGKLGELAEAGERLKQSGEFDGKTAAGSDFKGAYGVSVKTGLLDEDEQQAHPQPFDSSRRKKKAERPPVREVREPQVDIFEETDCVLVVAEMPGIGKNDLDLALEEDILLLSATRGEKKYRKEILLPQRFEEADMNVTVRNGVVEIKMRKSEPQMNTDEHG